MVQVELQKKLGQAEPFARAQDKLRRSLSYVRLSPFDFLPRRQAGAQGDGDALLEINRTTTQGSTDMIEV